MKKIHLDVESLAVETFDAEPAGDANGTVVGRELTNPLRSDCLNTCDGCPTYSCPPRVCL